MRAWWVFSLVLLVGGCAVKDYSPESFQHYSAGQLLQAGQRALSKHDYSLAAKHFEAIDALYPYAAEAKQGELNTIYAYYMAEDHASALAAAGRYIHLYPEDRYTDYAYYMRGIINSEKERTPLQRAFPRKLGQLDLTNLRDAFVNFSELLQRFPRSQYARDAEKRMIYIRDLLAEHEMQIAEFYLKRKAYVGAANRASKVVQHFMGASQVKRALQIMIESYQALGLERPAVEAQKVFQLNFPTG